MNIDLDVDKYIKEQINKGKTIGFIDEVGRGALAGDLYTCCVVLNNSNFFNKDINDSKQLVKSKIYKLSEILKQNVLWHLGVVTIEEINQIRNMHHVTMLAMKRSAETFNLDEVFVDGPWNIPDLICKQTPVIGGDGKVFGIACASIIAKECRDSYMKALAEQYPAYGFESNAGYRCTKHLAALKEVGVTPLHRSFYNDVLNATIA